MVFIDPFTFNLNIWVMKSLRILFLQQNNPFEQTQFQKVAVVNVENLLTLMEIHSVDNRKWFLLTYLLSFPIFDCSKVRTCCFWPNQYVWADTVLKSSCGKYYILLRVLERYVLQDRKNGFYWLVCFHCEFFWQLKNSKCWFLK